MTGPSTDTIDAIATIDKTAATDTIVTMRNRSSPLLAALATAAVLSACGGGGGGSSTPAPAANQAPLADAGAPQTVAAQAQVLLDASASSDPDGSISSYQWRQSSGAAVQLEGADTAQATFPAPTLAEPGALVFTVQVTDDEGATASASVTITVTASPGSATYRISGAARASASQEVDGDTNDPAHPATPNDTVLTAQPIANPTTVGGYVNQPGSGASGRSRLPGDVDDYFRVDMIAGQSITMLVADFQQADADLYLYDENGFILDFSIESGEIETLTVSRDGTYIVNAFAFEGATNYILAIGNQNAITGHASARRHEIIPWQSVVKYREGRDTQAGAGLTPGDIAERHAMEERAGGPGRSRLLALRHGPAAGQQALRRLGAARHKKPQIEDADLLARWETLVAIKGLRRDPQVEYAEPNYRVRSLATPNDEAYPFQWHYPLINLPAAWDTTTGDDGVIVAVVDTGILSQHPDIKGQLVAGYDFVRNRQSAGDGNGIDPDPEDPGDSAGAASSTFHGTHVGGTVAAAGDNGIGVAGVAYSARIMPLRALGVDGGGTSYDVDQAVRFAAGLANDSGTVPPRRADIINLSLGGSPFSQATQNLYNQVRAAGVAVVAAAGNEASSLPSYPASYDGVISVSAVDPQSRITSYSNTGRFVDIAAPGGNSGADLNGDGYPDGVLSTDGSVGATGINFVYAFLSGTSMAAPHVAGVLALMKSVNPALSPADIDALLVRGELSDDLGTAGRDDTYGHGLINAQRAVLAALEASGNSPADNPFLRASAATLNFSSTATELELELRNEGKGELTLLELDDSAPWLALAPLQVDAGGLGTYRVLVDRSGLDNGIYSGDIRARSSVNTLTIRVIMSVGDTSLTADVGVVYVLLVNADTDEVFEQRGLTATLGGYPFEFEGVPAGRYNIFAGSDADNDLFICDAGEACGAWLTTDQPIVIELEADLQGLDFPVEYLVAFPNTTAPAAARAGDQPARARSMQSVAPQR